MKKSVNEEMKCSDMIKFIKEMNAYAIRRLQRVDVKQLEGKLPEDFVQDILLKVLEGSRNWDEASINNFKKFLFGCLKSDLNHFYTKIDRRKISIVSIEDDKYSFPDNENCTTYANPNSYENLTDEGLHPKGYNNLDLKFRFQFQFLFLFY